LSFCVGNKKQTEIDVGFLWKYLGEYKPKKLGFVKGQVACKCNDTVPLNEKTFLGYRRNP
jgi:hypothetical protein